MKKEDQKLIRIECDGSEFIEAGSLEPLQGNLKSRTEDQVQKLRSQIEKYGFSFPFFFWKDGRKNFTMDGHGRDVIIKSMIADGYKCRQRTGKIDTRFPAVRIYAKDRTEAKEKLLALNSQYGTIIEQGLYDFLSESGSTLKFEDVKLNLELPDFDLEKFERKFFPMESKRIDELDDVPPVMKKPHSRKGDIFIIDDKHRLMCGDSTLPENVDQLMDGQRAIVCLTDPPYSVNYENLKRRKDEPTRKERGDSYKDPEAKDVLKFIALIPSDVLVMSYPVNKHFHDLSDFTIEWDLLYDCVWKKQHFAFVMGRNYQPKHEPVLIFRRKKFKNSYFNVPANESTVFEFPKPARNEEHPTIKPVGLYLKLVEYQSPKGDIIYEPFSGSGTTMVAAHELDRICYAMDIDPLYVDLTMKRMKKTFPDLSFECLNRKFNFEKLFKEIDIKEESEVEEN